MFWFLLGSGCLVPGTFFLWWRQGRSWWWLVGIWLAVVIGAVGLVFCCGQRELGAKLILGVVAGNVALGGGVSLITGKSSTQLCRTVCGWLVLGLVGCVWAASYGHIGVFTGLGLIIVGVVAMWQSGRALVSAKTKVDVLCQALWWVNLILVTLGLGLFALLTGGIHLAQSVAVVILPWLMGMVLVVVVASWLPKKTARVWGGLIVLLYLVLLWYGFNPVRI